MQVGTRDASRRAHGPDDVTGLHGIAHLHVALGEVRGERADRGPIDGDVVAVPRALLRVVLERRGRHDTVMGGPDGRARGRGDVDALVCMGFPRDGVGPRAHGGAERPGDRTGLQRRSRIRVLGLQALLRGCLLRLGLRALRLRLRGLGLRALLRLLGRLPRGAGRLLRAGSASRLLRARRPLPRGAAGLRGAAPGASPSPPAPLAAATAARASNSHETPRLGENGLP